MDSLSFSNRLYVESGFIHTACIHRDSNCIQCVDEIGSRGFSSHIKKIWVEE